LAFVFQRSWWKIVVNHFSAYFRTGKDLCELWDSRQPPRRRINGADFNHVPLAAMRMSRPASDHLFLTEGEIALRVGVSAIDWQAAAPLLEKSGLPRPDPLFGQLRYWPAVRAFLDRRAGMAQSLAPLTRDGEEHWDDDRGRKSRAGA
jgi:hypothetical protein